MLVVNKCKLLEYIAVGNISDAIAESCTKLNTLRLNRCPAITYTSVAALGSHSHNVVKFCFDCTNYVANMLITSAALAATFSKWQQLDSLHLKNVRNIEDDVLTALGRNCHMLTELRIMYILRENVSISDAGLTALTGCNHLQHLELQSCVKFSGEGLINIVKKCVQLRKLLVTSNPNVTNALVESIHSFKSESLEIVMFTDCRQLL